MRKLVPVLIFCMLGTTCLAQSVQQTGTITPNHLAIWATNGVIKDGGAPTSSANVIINQTQITSGINKGLLFNNNGVVGNLGTLANGLLVTDASGNPSISTILPAGTNLNLTIGVTGITSGTSKGLLYDNAGLLGNLGTIANGVLVTDASGNPSISTTLPPGLIFGIFSTANTWTNTQTINSPSGTTTQALVINGTLPINASPPNVSVALNRITFTNPGYILASGGSVDSFGSLPVLNSLRVEYVSNAAQEVNVALQGFAKESVGSDIAGTAGNAYINISATANTQWGVLGFTNTGSSGAVLRNIGIESESAIATGGSAAYHVGFDAVNLGPVQGTTLDAAYTVSVLPGGVTGTPPYASGSPWHVAFALTKGLFGGNPLDSTGIFIYSDSAFSTGSFVNMCPSSCTTFTDHIFKFDVFTMTGAGITVLEGPSGNNILTIQTTGTSGNIQSVAANNGTSGVDGHVINSSDGNEIFVGVAEASNTTVQFGQTTGDWAKIVTAGGTNKGLLFGTLTNTSIILGTNNVNRLSISQTGLITATLNSGISATAPGAGALFYMVGQDGANDNLLTMDQYGGGSTNTNALSMRQGGGTAAVPTQTLSGNTLGGLRFSGYNAAGSAFYRGASLFAVATNNFDNADGGTALQWYTTPTGSVTIALAVEFQASGGLSIGSTTDPGIGGLYVNGATITFNGLTTDNAHTDRTVCQDTTSKSLFFGSGAAGICLGTSSERFKHNIHPLDVGLKQIENLKPVSYELNADHGDPDKILYGFTAEQGETVLPALVGLDGMGRPQTFDYMGVVPVLVKAVQELKTDNDNLRTEMANLKRKISR